MDERDARVASFALGTLHATLFLVAFLLAFHLNGDLPFAGSGTASGVLAFVWLWGLTTWSAWQAGPALLRDDAPVGQYAKAGVFWGGVTGGGFLLGVALFQMAVTRELAFLGIALIGGLFALGIGGLIGLAMALLDAGLVALVRRLAP